MVYILRVQKTYGRIARKLKPLRCPPLWEEPRDCRKTRGDSVGIPAIHGGEDVKYRVPTLSVAPCCDRAFPRAVVLQSFSNSRASPQAQSPPAAAAQTAADASAGVAPAIPACQSS